MNFFLKTIGILMILLLILFALIQILFRSGILPNMSENASKILDSVPVYKNVVLEKEFKTGFPATPRIVRNYVSRDTRDDIKKFYMTSLEEDGWNVKLNETESSYVPVEIIADKDKWKLNILIYSTGAFSVSINF